MKKLTEREKEVLNQMARGKTNLEIAQALGIKYGTVKSHISNIFLKLGARNRVEATLKAFIPKRRQPLVVGQASENKKKGGERQ